MAGTEISEAVLNEALSKYIGYKQATFTPTQGGVNNIVRRARIDSSPEEYILRVYNNGENTAKVIFEHKVLEALRKFSFTYQLPSALPAIEDPHSTFTVLSNGAHASVWRIIPGTLPKLTAAEQIGEACGQLSAAFAQISVPDTPPTPPYFELYRVHHAINKELFFQQLKSSAFDKYRATADLAGAEIERLETLIADLLALQLPQQLIHGDLHADNILAENGMVTGVLDFEFCAMDWRAMDLAITLSKYASEPNPLPYFQQVIRGYKKHVTLTKKEIEVLADLIVLRILSNIVYFVGRAVALEDTLTTLTDRIEAYMRRIAWLRSNSGEVAKCFL